VQHQLSAPAVSRFKSQVGKRTRRRHNIGAAELSLIMLTFLVARDTPSRRSCVAYGPAEASSAALHGADGLHEESQRVVRLDARARDPGMLGLGGTICKIAPGTTRPVSFTSIGSRVGFTRGSDDFFYSSSYTLDEIWRIHPARCGAATLFAGSHATPGLVEAVGTAARFDYPSGMVSLGTNLYFAELNNYDIRGFDLGGQPSRARSGTWGLIKALYR